MKFEELPIYVKLNILVYTNRKTLILLSSTCKKLYHIFSNKLLKNDIKLFGNLTQRLYKERFEYWIKNPQLDRELDWFMLQIL